MTQRLEIIQGPSDEVLEGILDHQQVFDTPGDADGGTVTITATDGHSAREIQITPLLGNLPAGMMGMCEGMAIEAVFSTPDHPQGELLIRG